jgi:hypothetical protein
MPSYNPYYANNNFYMQSLQQQREAFDNQIRQMQQNQQQVPIPQIHQNFQLAPQQNLTDLEGQFAESVEEVRNKFVTKTALFITRDYSKLWIKDTSGNIRVFDIEEHIELDDKDKEIQMLREQINDLKEVIENANANANTVNVTSNNEPNESKTTKKVPRSK